MSERRWTAGRFVLRASDAKPPLLFSKLDVMRTERRVAISLPPSHRALVTHVGYGHVGGSDDWVELFSPEAVVEETERLRKLGLPARSTWANPALSHGLVVLGRFSFGDRLAWVGARERFLRVPSDTVHAVVDLGPDLGGALEQALHLMGAPTELDVTS